MKIEDKPGPARFDFGLSDQQEARAARLHAESIVFDMLSQGAGGNIFAHYPPELKAEFQAAMAGRTGLAGAVDSYFWPFEMSLQGRSDLIRDWLLGAGLTCGTYGIEVHSGADPHQERMDVQAMSYGVLPWLRHVTTAGEIRQAKRDGVLALYAHCQPTTPAPRSLRPLDEAYAKGLRSFMLTYNQMDNIGVGCTERVDAGLSMFGVEVVAHCNDIGIIVDVSHCGHLTTLDACRHSRKPVNANHSCSREVFGHARGKSDEALRAIADTGGVIGVVAVPFFLTDEPRPTVERMLDHIDDICERVGWRHVALGTDWPLQVPDEVMMATFGAGAGTVGFRKQDNVQALQRLVGFDDCRDLANITRGLVARGYSDEQIQGILGENALRVFAEVCG